MMSLLLSQLQVKRVTGSLSMYAVSSAGRRTLLMTSWVDAVAAAMPGEGTESPAVAMLQFAEIVNGEEARKK